MPQSLADELKSFPMSAHLGESLERARRFAREQSHRVVTLEHLLLALTEDIEAIIILEAAEVDLARLSADVSGYLGRLLEDMRAQDGAEPQPDGDMLRVLHAATTAARQSRRQHIDGAIVLAAIVGDGKSPAAGLLKALGMTFESAIRALQRANTQARLKPASARPAAPTGTSLPALARPAGSPAPANGEARAHPADARASATATLTPVSTTADDFLAAARARIQQRAAARAAGKPPPNAAGVAAPARAEPTPAGKEAPAPTVDGGAKSEPSITPLTAGSLAAAIREVSKGESAAGGPPQPAAPAAEASRPSLRADDSEPAAVEPRSPQGVAPPPAAARPSRIGPAPRPGPSTHRGPPIAGAQAPAPFPPRPLRAGEGPARPPLPSGAGAGPLAHQPMPAPHRSPRAGRPPNGAAGPHPHHARPGPAPSPHAEGGGLVVPLQPRLGVPPPSPAHSERGPLVENVPRRMRQGRRSIAEVHIARDHVDALILALSNRGLRPEAFPTRALAVRLRAPNGGFTIEAESAETIWIERSPGQLHDSIATWRWTVTPHRSGRNRLLLTVSARMLGPDGLVADSAPSDRSIEVSVGADYRGRSARWAGVLIALAAGGLLGRFSGEIWNAAVLLMRQITGA